MSWYKSPIRPIDPIVSDVQPEYPERYIRDNFEGTGLDLYTQPPAQDQSMWTLLTNVMPITDGTLHRRWGAQFFTTNAQFGGNTYGPYTRAYQYRNDLNGSTGTRRLIFMGGSFDVFNEDGTVYTASAFGTRPNPMFRGVLSRNWFYMCNTQSAFKWADMWNGVNFPNWGIAAPVGATSSVITSGPNPPTTATNIGSWSNPNNILVSDNTYAVESLATGITDGGDIQATGFGFAIPSNATITGFRVEVQAKATTSGSDVPELSILLLKAGVIYGGTSQLSGFQSLVSGAPETFISFGGNGDLFYGALWTPADVNASNFGVQIHPMVRPTSSGPATFNIDFVRVTVFYTTVTGAINATPGGGAGITLSLGRVYYCVFENSRTGHFSDLNPSSGSTGPLNNQNVNLTNIPVSGDNQVDKKVILATADGGDPSTLYLVAEIPNSSTTYTDSTPELTLLNNQIYVYTDQFGTEFGVANNTPPPLGQIMCKHKGRLWMAVQENLFFSKSVDELTLPDGFIAGKYEEAWPADSYFDVSNGAETITGLLSDGNVLYIGTTQHVRRLFGDSPSNFQQPEIVHTNVGVVNQEVWQMVYMEGTPAGAIWLTPDGRVIQSDGNTYVDIGKPVQPLLNGISPGVMANSHAAFMSDGEFDLYFLCIPSGSNYGDVHLVYDLRSQRWFEWVPPVASASILYNVKADGTPQWLFCDDTAQGVVYRYTPGFVTDNGGANIFVTATTAWLHMGDPTYRKVLDELEVTTQDPGLTVSVSGSSGDDGFSGTSIVANAALKTSPFGQKKIYFPGTGSKHRYYKVTFSTSTATDQVILGYSFRFTPWNTL